MGGKRAAVGAGGRGGTLMRILEAMRQLSWSSCGEDTTELTTCSISWPRTTHTHNTPNLCISDLYIYLSIYLSIQLYIKNESRENKPNNKVDKCGGEGGGAPRVAGRAGAGPCSRCTGRAARPSFAESPGLPACTAAPPPCAAPRITPPPRSHLLSIMRCCCYAAQRGRQ